MLSRYINQILKQNPEYAGIIPVIEKEILHHDIMHVLVEQGALQQLTFIGGTSLRLCYNSSRLSEDLDFNGGHDFKPSDFNGLENDIQHYLSKKYEVEVWVNKPSQQKQGKPSSWKISIERESNRPDIPRQKMHIDVCAIPSFDAQKRPLINHYGIDVATEGYLIPTQSLEETLADKFIALAYRSRRIKPRDLWDIVWINQQGIKVNSGLAFNKLQARGKRRDDFFEMLQTQLNRLNNVDEVKTDFNSEMSRFLPAKIKQRTLDNPDYWVYLKGQVNQLAQILISSQTTTINPFDMSI
jgi:predicted nucleotidyltransferase component of viral defense system